MPSMPLITTMAAALGLALVLGMAAVKLRLPALVGYLLAGVAIGPFTPGYVADVDIATQLAEIGVMLLMFGVGLHFSWSDLLSVRKVALPGALVQMTAATALGWALGQAWGWTHLASIIFGLSLSVASTVVLLRALEAQSLVTTHNGKVAIGWLVVEDLAMVLVLVLLSALLSLALGMSEQAGLTVGALPQGLPDFYFPSLLSWEGYKSLMVPTLAITLVSFMETASSAKVDNGQAGKTWDQDQDLIGQGLAKLAAGFSGAFPTSSSFSRSALNLYAGAQTGWATVISVVVILLALLVLTPVLAHVPQSVLSAIVLAAVLGLLKPQAFVRLFKINRVEGTIALLTFGITLLAAPRLYWGVLAGVVMGLSHFLHTRLHPRIIEVGLHDDGSLRDRHLWKLPPLAPHLYALRMDAELDFAAASSLERAVMEHLALHPNVHHVCLFALPINRVDATGVEALAKLEHLLHERSVTLHISGMKLPVETVLRRAGCLQDHPLLKMYRTDAEAIQQLRQLETLPADMGWCI